MYENKILNELRAQRSGTQRSGARAQRSGTQRSGARAQRSGAQRSGARARINIDGQQVAHPTKFSSFVEDVVHGGLYENKF